MDISALSQYFVLVVVGICLCVGYVIKHTNIITNRWIPLIMLVLGLAVNVLINLDHITAEVILGGMISGLASTGLHQAFSQLIEGESNVS